MMNTHTSNFGAEAAGVVSPSARGGNINAVALGAADWLCLAAAPTFAGMALVTGFFGGTSDMICSPLHDPSPINGMVLMYLLMSAFHSSPWVKLISSRLRGNHNHLATA